MSKFTVHTFEDKPKLLVEAGKQLNIAYSGKITKDLRMVFQIRQKKVKWIIVIREQNETDKGEHKKLILQDGSKARTQSIPICGAGF